MRALDVEVITYNKTHKQQNNKTTNNHKGKEKERIDSAQLFRFTKEGESDENPS